MFTFRNELQTTDKFKKNITFMFLFLDLLFVSCTYAFPNMDIVGVLFTTNTADKFNFRIRNMSFQNKQKNSILKYKCIVYS